MRKQEVAVIIYSFSSILCSIATLTILTPVLAGLIADPVDTVRAFPWWSLVIAAGTVSGSVLAFLQYKRAVVRAWQ